MTPSAVLQDIPVLAADIGGTKILVALVRGNKVLTSRLLPTLRDAGPVEWMSALHEVAIQWRGEFDCVGVTVSGQVESGVWKSVNPATLSVGKPFDIAASLSRIGAHFEVLNDAQSAAWGEHVYGVGQGSDLVYLTVSTGLGGGIVCNGKLLQGQRGLAGHFGLVSQNLTASDGGAEPFEDLATGRWIANQALTETGIEHSSKSVFENAREGKAWARRIVSTSALRVAKLCRDISFVIDPPMIVIGGGIGLAEGFVAEIERHLNELIPNHNIDILTSVLREKAGIVGIAAIAAQSHIHQERNMQ